MKRITTIFSIMATSVLLTATPLLAAESDMERDAGKNECLLVSLNCADNVDSIQQRIERLNREIAKGTDVYTVDELNNLNSKREEAIRQLEELTAS